MRVLIMSDMEGVSGIVTWAQVTGGEKYYDECRVLYTEEINAAVRGALAAGATELVAVDCHGAGKEWNFNSFIPEMMECDWVAGHAWSRYTELLEQQKEEFAKTWKDRLNSKLNEIIKVKRVKEEAPEFEEDKVLEKAKKLVDAGKIAKAVSLLDEAQHKDAAADAELFDIKRHIGGRAHVARVPGPPTPAGGRPSRSRRVSPAESGPSRSSPSTARAMKWRLSSRVKIRPNSWSTTASMARSLPSFT